MVLARTAVKQTVQEFNPKDSTGNTSAFHTFFWRQAILPAWGDSRRQKALLDFYYDPYNWIIQGAFAAIAKQVASTPYEIKGDQDHKVLTRHFEQVLSGAQFDDFGGGFRGFIIRLVLDFLRFDDGAFVEIIGKGSPKRAIKGRVSGVATLNAMRCSATGTPETPVVYFSRRTGEMHRLHKTRVARIVDMPDSVEDETGRGLSALSRSISVAQSMMLQIKYNIQRLDDLPPAGLLAVTNVKHWDDAVELYEQSRKRDGGSVWANVMVVEGLEPDKPANIQHTPFATVPEHFNFRDYTEVMVNALALALNVDPQDIWPLSGAPIGTGTQSKILHTKAAGKMLGDIHTAITRLINFYILPDSLEFQFKFKDTERDKEESLNQDRYSIVAKRIQDIIDPLGRNDPLAKEISLQYLANTAETFADVLLDSEGGIRLPDDDPKDPDQQQTTFTDPGTVDELTAESETSTTTGNGIVSEDEIKVSSENPLEKTAKDIQATRLDFEGDVEDAIQAAVKGSINRRRFGTIMRAHVVKYGSKAFKDGLKKGGVDEPRTGRTDKRTIANIVATQSQFITQLGDAIYKEGLTPEQAATKPTLWYNKSIVPFHQAGIASADRNGMYEWVLGSTKEHCRDCKRFNGQRKRMKTWIRGGVLPKSSSLECNGFNCKCILKKTLGASRGG